MCEIEADNVRLTQVSDFYTTHVQFSIHMVFFPVREQVSNHSDEKEIHLQHHAKKYEFYIVYIPRLA